MRAWHRSGTNVAQVAQNGPVYEWRVCAKIGRSPRVEAGFDAKPLSWCEKARAGAKGAAPYDRYLIALRPQR